MSVAGSFRIESDQEPVEWWLGSIIRPQTSAPSIRDRATSKSRSRTQRLSVDLADSRVSGKLTVWNSGPSHQERLVVPS
jgi:hypothetical protein